MKQKPYWKFDENTQTTTFQFKYYRITTKQSN